MRRLVLLALAACTAHTPSPTGHPVPPVTSDAAVGSVTPGAPPPPSLRLPDSFTPTHYTVALAIDPSKPDFTGHITITGTVAAATHVIWLDADGLTITSGKVIAEPHDFVGIQGDFAEGPVTLDLDYRGTFSTSDSYGAFVETQDGDPYAFTQFEPLGARKVFPCVDEPWAKVPWQLTLTVPDGDTAISNAPIAKQDGDTITFAETKPLPSYLVAFAVGPFVPVDAGKTSGGAPIRVIAFKGHTDDVVYPAKVTAKIVSILEDWFGTPYPFEKLDLVPIPSTVGFGAMENAGMITFRGSRLLLGKKPAENDKRGYVWTAGHEIAHQWFGDLVTPKWWDDLWLNESFATWMEDKALSKFSPAWGLRVPMIVDRSDALDEDGLLSVRQVHQPISTAADIETAFDDITYQKGSAVIRMFEQYIGADDFQKGVRQYLKDHAYGTATTADFLAAVDAATPKDVTGAFQSFLDHPGEPRIAAELTCENKKATVTLSQSRWLPKGVTANTDDAPLWQVPVCVAYGNAKVRNETCTMLDQASATVALDGGCPTWLLQNSEGRGYFRSAFTADQLTALEKKGWSQLGPHERVLIAGDVRAGVQHGDLDLGAELDLVPMLLADGQRSRVSIEVATGFADDALEVASDDARTKLAAWVLDVFGPRARKAGLLPDKGDDADRERSRAVLVELDAQVGRDPKLLERAVELAKKWHDLPESVRGVVLAAAARGNGDVRVALRTEAAKLTDPLLERELWGALAATDDPAEAGKALALLLDSSTDLKEAMRLLSDLAEDPHTQPTAEQFLRDHWDELLPRLPAEGAADLVYVVTASCDAAKRADAAKWAHDKVDPLVGGTRTVDQALEGMDRCIDRKASLSPELDAWLTARH